MSISAHWKHKHSNPIDVIAQKGDVTAYLPRVSICFEITTTWQKRPTFKFQVDVFKISWFFGRQNVYWQWCSWKILNKLIIILAIDLFTVDMLRLHISITEVHCLTTIRANKFSYEGAVVLCCTSYMFRVTWGQFALLNAYSYIQLMNKLWVKMPSVNVIRSGKKLWLFIVLTNVFDWYSGANMKLCARKMQYTWWVIFVLESFLK